MRTRDLFSTTFTVLALAAGLAGCGGGNNSNAIVTTPPASANASASGFIAFLLGLVSDETSEPLAIDTLNPPLEDTTEPIPLT